MRLIVLSVFSWAFCGLSVSGVDDVVPLIHVGKDGLVYEASVRGDRIPDFSHCGYEASATAIPMVATRLSLTPSGSDDTLRIQAALNQLASMPPDASGWRGALQLSAGRFEVAGSLLLVGNGCVLRGTGSGDGQTKLVATGPSRRSLIVVGGKRSPERDPEFSALISEYVPVGAMTVVVENGESFRVGQSVRVDHPSTLKWISALGMNSFPSDDGRGSWLDWKPGTLDLSWHRTIVRKEGNRLFLDAPLTSALDPQLSPAAVHGLSEDRLTEHIGVECLTLVSQADSVTNPKDEEHAWDAVQLNEVRDAWVRSITCRHFVGSAVHIGRFARRITVVDCESSEPISEDAGWRRHTFYTLGEQSLFLRCRAEQGRHDFAVGPLACGPNAFIRCTARRATAFSGPIGSWASGVLYDNVEIDGAGLALTNRETTAQGTGWSAANCVLWNCVAPTITCRKPPLANNWAIGIWGEVVGDGLWRQLNEYTSPESLYSSQLAERIGRDKAAQILKSEVAFPMYQENLTVLDPKVVESLQRSRSSVGGLRLKNGWLAMGDRLAIGSRLWLSWWRGSVMPAKVPEFGPGLTRFVPSRDEPGYTDDLAEVAQRMQARGQIAVDHHWGLWYDRRRDDHQMIRRSDGDVWPPFYEQPWARSGIGRAWDGLSLYDLTRFNPWYFGRLEQFAEQADQRGLVLIQQMYFQHNILEAGAHWADFPWRPANCLQKTGFPEPPVYQNRKRIFMAEEFYDVSHPVRRDLHTRYIRHCLDTLGKYKNVLFVLGEEFTGPEHFVRFWLETISQWERETGREVLVVLSATRDVQSSILSQPNYAALVDVIDCKYWWYTKDGTLYDPPGGQNLAPRQQLREWTGPKSRSPESLSRAVQELRRQFPEKAVICSIAEVDPWLIVAAGGSLPALPQNMDARLRSQLLELQPTREGTDFALQSNERLSLVIGNHEIAPAGFVRVNPSTGTPFADGSKGSKNPSVFWRP